MDQYLRGLVVGIMLILILVQAIIITAPKAAPIIISLIQISASLYYLGLKSKDVKKVVDNPQKEE